MKYSKLTSHNTVQLVDDKAEFIVLDKGYILPPKYNKEKEWGDGGVLDFKKFYVEKSGFYGWTEFGGYYDFHDYDTLNENVIWFGNFHKHWGHFIFDHLSRLWYVLKNYKDEKIIYVGDELDGNFLDLITLFGVKKENIVRIHNPTLISKKIIVPEYSFENGTYKREFFEIFEFLRKKSEQHNYSFSEKIYFSRKKFQFAKQKEFGEENIENNFKKNGYEIVFPEKINLLDQISIWNNAKEIVCINGTIPLNICFSSKEVNNQKVIVLNKTKIPHDNLFIFAKIFNKEICYIDTFDPRINLAKNIGAGPFLLNPYTNLKIFFKDNNMLWDDESFFSFKKYFFIISFLVATNSKKLIKLMLPKKMTEIFRKYKLRKAYNGVQ